MLMKTIKVIFYNRGEERVFPRSAGIIGREVRFVIRLKVWIRFYKF